MAPTASLLSPPRFDGAERTTLGLAGLPGRFHLDFQPEVDLRSGAIDHCEALLRWMHPDFGVLRPGPSLSGSRWSDQVQEIEDWALRAVCVQGAEWDLKRREIEIALNVTTTQVTRPDFLTIAARALAASGVHPNRIAIDVPVCAVALEPKLTKYAMAGLEDLGVRVTLDGVRGDTSFQVLDQVRATAWKIELGQRGYRRPGQHHTVHAALTRARDAGVVAVAKAVEDEVTLRGVQEMGFDRAFGYAISQALPAAELDAFRDLARARRRSLFGPPTAEA